MEKRYSYRKKLNKILFLSIFIPLLIALAFFVRYEIGVIYANYTAELDNSVGFFEKRIGNYAAMAYQRARFINYYQEINKALIQAEPLAIDGDMIAANKRVNEIVKTVFSDTEYAMDCIIYTNNLNAIPLNIIEKYHDNAFYSSITDDYMGEWRIEHSDSQYMLNYYKKFSLIKDYSNVIKISVPLRNIMRGMFDESKLSEVCIKIYSNYINGAYADFCYADERISQSFKADLSKMYEKKYSLDLINSEVHMFLPRNEINRDIARLIALVLMGVAGVVCLVVLITGISSRSLTGELASLVKSIELKTIDNIEDVSIKNREFKVIQDYLINIRETLARESNEKIDFETRMLAQRITPHFIYNNLSAIKSFCDDRTARDAVDMLIKYCRKLFGNRDRFITVSREFENAEEYLKILSFCYDMDFDMKIFAEERCQGMYLPANILQPILENAFIHGINCLTDKKGEIDISANFEENMLVVRVTDNAGMFDKNKYTNQKEHALDVLKKQINLYYKDNDKCRINIFGRDGCTTVEVIVTGGLGI